MTTHRPTLFLLALVAIAGTVSLWRVARANAGMDFYQMWVGGRAGAGTRDFYTGAARERIGAEYLRRARVEEASGRRVAVAEYRRQLETVSTPFLYLAFAGFRGSYERDLLIFQLLVFGALVAWVAVLAAAYRYSGLLALGFYCFLVLIDEPVRSDVRVVNANHFVLLLIA